MLLETIVGYIVRMLFPPFPPVTRIVPGPVVLAAALVLLVIGIAPDLFSLPGSSACPPTRRLAAVFLVLGSRIGGTELTTMGASEFLRH